jgi:hypothetical protein
MKNIPLVRKAGLITAVCFCLFTTLHAQTFEEENIKAMDRMDVSGLKEKVVLNKAILIEEMLVPFQNREKDQDGATVTVLPPGMLPDLIELAERGDMENKKKPEAIEKILKRRRKEITDSQVVPVGIINLDARMLTEAQERWGLMQGLVTSLR